MKKGIYKYIGALMVGTALMAVPSCTDTWDDHYSVEDGNTATENLWEIMKNDHPELSNFCAVLEKARYYRDENHPAYSEKNGEKVYYTFKDILQANTPITVWAPTNDAEGIDWDNLMEMAENDGYNLQQQFIGNHIALYRKSMKRSGKETLRLINSKFATLDYDNGSIQDIQIEEQNKDIPATNGLLNIIPQRNEFFFNLYEYIKFSGEVNTFRDYLVLRDTTYFLESASIEGLPDENGNPTYVDSVYFQDNMMFFRTSYNPTDVDATDGWMNNLKMLNAYINAEDSAIVMIIPSDNAWQEATAKLKPYYNYTPIYPRMDKTRLDNSPRDVLTIRGGVSDYKGEIPGEQRARKPFEKMKNPELGSQTVDSLQRWNIEMDMIAPLAFNLSSQKQINGEVWTMENFITKKGYRNCEYLINTQGDTIRNVYETIDGVKTLVWDKNSLFEGSGVKEIKKMSNGYAVITDKWNLPRDYWMRDIDIDVSLGRIYEEITNSRLNEFAMTNSTTKDWIDMYGRCSEQRFLNVRHASNSNPWIVVGLYGSKQGDAYAMSGKYDVQIVLVPDWYKLSNETYPETMYPKVEDPEDPGYENNYKVLPENIKKNKLSCTLYFWDESLMGNNNFKYDQQMKVVSEQPIEFSGEKMDTITVFTDVEFPCSYKNLLRTYPVLKIESIPEREEVSTGGYTREFSIDRIILKSKEND